MLIDDHIAAIRREGQLLVEAVARADLDSRVPTCPEWTVRELAQHQGRVHRWATTYVADARTAMMSAAEDERSWGEMPPDAGLVAWLSTGWQRLVAALEVAPAELQCWSFLPAPTPLAFWARRQAHETAVHRVDAQLAGRASVAPLGRDFAIDGLDELLLCFFSRPRNRLRLPRSRRLAVLATDTSASWIIHIGPDGARAERAEGSADAEISGRAEDLYLGLWNRRPLSALAVAGETELAELWQEKARIAWS